MLSWRAALLLALTATFSVAVVLAFGLTDVLELPARDLAIRILPSLAPRSTVVVEIDEQSLARVGAWPWPRQTMAALIRNIRHAGAKGIVLDVLLAEPRPGDELLADACRGFPVVAVAAIDEGGRWVMPSSTLSPDLHAAHGLFEVERDGLVRRIATTKQTGERSLTALSLEAAGTLSEQPVPVGQILRPGFRSRARAIPRLRASDVLSDNARLDQLAGKIIFIGLTAQALGDRVLTPTSSGSPEPGVTVQASATESILHQDLFRTTPPWMGGVAAGLLVLTIARSPRRRVHRLALASSAFSILTIASVALLEYHCELSPWLTLSLLLIAAVLTSELIRFASVLRLTGAATTRLESGLGLSPAGTSSDDDDEVGLRLESISANLASRQREDLESRRMLAHELRTPLASMRNLTGLLSRFELTEAERSRVSALLETETGRLQSLVQTLLEMEHLSLRSFDESASHVDLSDLAARRVEFLSAGTPRPLRFASHRGIAVRADPVLIERVIDNLVSNAMKYSPAGLPVDVRVLPSEGRAVLEVEDQGSGIPEDEREKIFRRFVRGSTAGGSEGLGLGLAMVSEIVRWHRGSITVESAAGSGSLFRVTLPCDDFPPAMKSAATTAASECPATSSSRGEK